MDKLIENVKSIKNRCEIVLMLQDRRDLIVTVLEDMYDVIHTLIDEFCIEKDESTMREKWDTAIKNE